MADVTWDFAFENGDVATASGLAGLSQRATFRQAAAVDPTPTFTFETEAAYQIVRNYVLEATNATVATGRVRQNTAYYRERPPSRISSFVVEVTPGAGIDATSAFWAVIQGGTDATSAVGSNFALEIDLFVLADASAYADHAAVETALGTEVV